MRNASTKEKVQGLLKKFCKLDYLYKACAYLDVVEVIVPCSKVFESNELLPFHLAPTLKILDSNLTDMVDNDPEEIAIDSHVRLFTLSESEDGKQLVKRTYLKAGHERRNIQNREDIDVVMENITHSRHGTSASVNACARVAADLKLVLNTRFADLSGLPQKI